MKKTYIQPTSEAISLITEGAVANLVIGSGETDQMLSNKKGSLGGGGWDSDDWTQTADDTEE